MKIKFLTVLLFALVSSGSCLRAQNAPSSEPNSDAPFTLTISAKAASVESGHVRPLMVKEKNISNRDIDLTQQAMDISHWYQVEIHRNGAPVAKTKEMLRREQPFSGGMVQTNGPFFLTLKPGDEAESEFPISDAFDMSEPGVYEITLALEVDALHSGKPILVRSNTITITVVPKPEETEPK